MANLVLMNFRRFLMKSSVRKKVLSCLDNEVFDSLENEQIKPRKHPGILKLKPIRIPDHVVEAMEVVLSDEPVNNLLAQSAHLVNYLKARHPPSSMADIEKKQYKVKEVIENKYDLNNPLLGDEEKQFLRDKLKHEYCRVVKQHLYNWEAIQYDKLKSHLYLLGRSAAEYAVLYKIFFEISLRVPDFKPKTVFDFGSGVGTVAWAVNSFWKGSIIEYFAVDSSRHMNDLAELLLKGGNSAKPTPKGTFFRQFLPASHSLKYDVVVSAYSLLELPSAEARLDIVRSLWRKTQRFLILVEHGTNAGFKVIVEARDFILSLSDQKKDLTASYPAHVFSPCPHEYSCPRLAEDKTPCNFEVTFNALPVIRKEDHQKEYFSFVVLEKGERDPNSSQWPRIVRPVLLRSKRAICRLCTSNGKLKDITFTAAKHGKYQYRCAKHSRWGDLLPVVLTEYENDED